MTPALEALIAEAERLTVAQRAEWSLLHRIPATRADLPRAQAQRVAVARAEAAYDAFARASLPALASALRRAERVVEAARDARMELGRAWQDWDADRDAKAGKRIANAATTLIDALRAHDQPDATGETGRE